MIPTSAACLLSQKTVIDREDLLIEDADLQGELKEKSAEEGQDKYLTGW